MSVFLSAPTSQQPHCPNFTKFSIHVTCGCDSVSSDNNAIRYVFPVLWVTSRFHIMEPVGESKARRYVSSSSPGCGSWGEVCHPRLYLVPIVSLHIMYDFMSLGLRICG